MNTRMIALSFAGALALAACARTPAAAPPETGAESAFKPCKVEDYQSYVGRNRSTVPAPPHGQTFRVLCTTCPATMDYRENRVNFVFDQATGVIQQVKCG
jgi:hypothetical protein